MYKVCLPRVLRDPACWGRTRAAAPNSREEEGGGRRSGREGVVGMRREGETGRKRQRKRGVGGAQLPELSRLLLARAREKGKGSD